MNSGEDEQPRETWIAPEIRTLDVAQTERFPGVGPDGNVRFPDCSRS